MEEDRISDLGDEILLHILCSINIKQAVQTSILSKRWRNLWTSMPDLNFNFRSMANPLETENLMRSFTNFVKQFLSHRDQTSTIRKFQLSGSQHIYTDPGSVAEWIDSAINHGVQHIDLDFLMGYFILFKFPSALFGCETLQELRLKQPGSGFVIPKLLVLPNLKSLFLERFTFQHDNDNDDYNFQEEPFSGFPNLEKLSLHHCSVYNPIRASLFPVIISSKLRILEIFYFKGRPEVKQISTPVLTSFRLEGNFPLEFPKVNFSCLEEVYLNISTKIPFYRAKKEIFLNLVKMLQQLGNAKAVTLTLDTMEFLETDPLFLEQSASPFPYMESLKVTKGCREIDAVLQSVVNYLVKGYWNVMVELPKGVSVVQERIPPHEYVDEEQYFAHLFD